MCPTRELARQTYRESIRLCEGTGLRVNIINKINTVAEKFNKNTLKKFGKSAFFIKESVNSIGSYKKPISFNFILSDILITTPNRLVYLLKQEPPMVSLKK